MRKLTAALLVFVGACTDHSTAKPETSFALKLEGPESISIILDRGFCFGTCPSYYVEIHGDGSVQYCGEGFVEHLGVRTKTIQASQARALFDRIMSEGFFDLPDGYHAGFTDAPTYQIQVSYDGKSKTLIDYAGLDDGMPEFVIELESAIDETAGTAEWVGGVRDYDQSLERPICKERLPQYF